MTDIAGNASTTAVMETLNGGASTFSGQLETGADHDWIRISLLAGNTYDFFLALQKLGSIDGDSELTLRDASGAVVGHNDDNGVSLNSFLEFKPTVTGTYYLDVSSHSPVERGAYSVLATDLSANNVFKSGSNDNYIAHVGERIAGGAGNDFIDLDDGGADALGEQGDDVLQGNDFMNILSGGVGNDFASGGKETDFLFGDAGDDTLSGGEGNDQMFGGDGLDDLFGGTGNDHLSGGAGEDDLLGQEGDDVLNGGAGADQLNGGADSDTFVIAGSEGLGDIFIGGTGTDTLLVTGASAVTLAGFNATASSIEKWAGKGQGVLGTSAADVFDFSGLAAKTGLAFVDGQRGSDTLIGSKLADDLRGGDGDDRLLGGLGDDKLTGGLGRDALTGGAGKDTFDFNLVKESALRPGSDQITDFDHKQGDRIDLSTIDANSHTSGNQAFRFIGSHAFSHDEGQLRLLGHFLQGDVNGDGKADFEIRLNVASLHTADLIL